MQYDSRRTGSLCNDTLYIVDGADNTIVAVSTASSLLEKDEIVVQPGGKTFKCAHPKTTSCATLVYSGSPLNAPVASALLPNGNLIVANTKGGNKLVELTPTGKIRATKIIDRSAVAHVFGLVATGTSDSDTALFYTTLKTNTLQKLGLTEFKEYRLACDNAGRRLRFRNGGSRRARDSSRKAARNAGFLSAEDHRVDEQVTFVDETGFEREPRKLGAPNLDVVLHSCLSFRIASASKSRSTRALASQRLSAFVKRRSSRFLAKPVRSRAVRVDSPPPAHPNRPSSHRAGDQ